jgi:L-ascorbate metabolism protein UlaG (beta-lactamase superfamily)
MTSPQPTSTRIRGGKAIRRLVWATLVITTVPAVLVGAFMIMGPEAIGRDPSGARLARAQRSPQWHDKQFENPQPIWADVGGAWRRLAFGPSTPDAEPDAPLPVIRTVVATLTAPPASGLRVTWFGHSSVLMEIDGSRVLIDPFWSERASPVGWAGPRRWYSPPIALTELPDIDAVVISHDHYDHLDYTAVTAMKSWRAVFVVPLGIGAHLSQWGIPERQIIELDWWQAGRVGALEVVATPARHASGRISTKRDKTLWAGFAFIGPQHRAWYSGDTGFHDELPRIGERLGPFDVTLVEAGQYDANWPDTHLGPELAVEAHRLVRGKVMIPVHWALLKLAPHAWIEPGERVLAAARCQGIAVLLPRPGESVEPAMSTAATPWWPKMPWRSAATVAIAATRNGEPSDRVVVTPCASEIG